MSTYYLIDGSFESNIVRLDFYDPIDDKVIDIRDEDYKPYFLANFPLSDQDEKTLHRLGARVSTLQKEDLFTGNQRTMTKVEMEDPLDLQVVSRQFNETWEDDVPYVLGYVYDQGLVFGAPYDLTAGKVRPANEIPYDLRLRFKERFYEIEKTDSLKYEMLDRWFTLCSQSIPKISMQKIGIEEDVTHEQFQLAFLLSRIANLPLKTAIAKRHVSIWIKSIFQSYLRRNNVLIPRSVELKKGDDIHRVQGALTFQPRSGTYFNTVVLDFESLYPSLIDTYNLSYETIDCGDEDCVNNAVPGLAHYVCKHRRGIYSALIGALRDLRIRWFKILSRDDSVSHGERQLAGEMAKLLKLILVSCYGVTVRIHGLAQPSLAESITAYGRFALKESWEIALSGNLHPIYGDTDSLFIDDPSEDQIEWLVKTVRERLQLDLAVDEVYSVCVLPRAMKAYFGVRKDGTADIKGITATKSSSPPFIQTVLRNCVKQLANVKNWAEFETAKDNIRKVVKKAISELKSGNVSLKDLEYTVMLHFDPSKKPTEEAFHQPYQCALQLLESGKEIHKGDIMSFLKVKSFRYAGKTFTVRPTQLAGDFHEINVSDYTRNLMTSLNQIFRPMDISFKEESEATLADFI